MKTITLQPQRLTKNDLLDLEVRGLVRTIRPPHAITIKPEVDMVTPLYVCDERSGPHQLICVRKNQTTVRLTRHSDNEEVIFLNPHEARYRPLYLVIAYHSYDVLQEKAHAGTLSQEDFRAFTIPFNDPETLIFAILKDTPHCEVTAPGPGEAPVFYVTEPASMTMDYVDLAEISLNVL
ncbi:MAG: hypothetical protein JW938_07480 [Candidatus Omnitrophica bacterium]|nr:hypothetical protein [Candidatus Omnitrophota bacterium]